MYKVSAKMRALSYIGGLIILVIIAFALLAEMYVTSAQSTQNQISTENQQIASLESRLTNLENQVKILNSIKLPVMNQTPAIRTVRETWYLSPSAHQDRFDPAFIIVNQGDTIRLTLIDNDTVAHDFVIGPPYNIVVNATVPGLINDLTGEVFTTPALHNSPGVVVKGTPGNVSATYTFKALYAGIFEFVCTYHAQVGMIGYLVVLPNAAYHGESTTTTSTTQAKGQVEISIIPGSGIPYPGYGNGTSKLYGYEPLNATIVIGVNNTVTWVNNDSTIHTVTANNGLFDSGYLNPGDSYTYTFTKPGVYEYHCQIHPWMIGYITVLQG